MWDLPVTFYFEVVFDTVSLGFKEVSGLQAEMDLEEFAEGGVNDYTHRLPKRIKHGNLVLKRALRTTKYKEVIWIRDVIEAYAIDKIKTKDILINLLNANGKPLAAWTCQNAFPVKWEIDALDSEKNSVLIETLEFSYNKLIRQR